MTDKIIHQELFILHNVNKSFTLKLKFYINDPF